MSSRNNASVPRLLAEIEAAFYDRCFKDKYIKINKNDA